MLFQDDVDSSLLRILYGCNNTNTMEETTFLIRTNVAQYTYDNETVDIIIEVSRSVKKELNII